VAFPLGGPVYRESVIRCEANCIPVVGRVCERAAARSISGKARRLRIVSSKGS
jgi:hypothetical protein